jgi:hypothetical protein
MDFHTVSEEIETEIRFCAAKPENSFGINKDAYNQKVTYRILLNAEFGENRMKGH